MPLFNSFSAIPARALGMTSGAAPGPPSITHQWSTETTQTFLVTPVLGSFPILRYEKSVGGSAFSDSYSPNASMETTVTSTTASNICTYIVNIPTTGTYTISLYHFIPSGSTIAGRTITIQREAGDAPSSTVSAPATLVAGSWVRSSLTETYTTTGSRTFVWRLSGTLSTAVGQTIYHDNCLIEKSPGAGPYFDGSTSGAHLWLGTRQESSSVQRGMRQNLLYNPSFEEYNSEWNTGSVSVAKTTSHSRFRNSSLLVTSTSASDTEARVGQTINWPVIPNQNYIGSLYLKNVAGNTRTHRLLIRWTDALGAASLSTNTDQTVAVDNTWYRLSITAKAPADAVSADLMLYTQITNPSTSNQTAIDGAMVEVGTTLNDYFDGSIGSNTSWSGSEYSSVSNMSGRENLCTNPSFETNTTGWGAHNSTNTHTSGTISGGSGSYSLVNESTSTAAGGAFFWVINPVPGMPITASANVLRLVGSRSYRLGFEFYNQNSITAVSSSTPSAGSVRYTTSSDHNYVAGNSVVISGLSPAGYNGTFTITSVPSSTEFVVTNSETGSVTDSNGLVNRVVSAQNGTANACSTSTRLTVSTVVPATTTLIAFTIYSSNTGSIGDEIQVDSVLIEYSSTVGTYFDGNTSASTAWTGTQHGSTSLEYGAINNIQRTNLCSNPSFEIGTTGWSTANSIAKSILYAYPETSPLTQKGTITIDALTPNTSYSSKFRAVDNSLLNGAESNTVTRSTREELPPTAPTVTVTQKESTGTSINATILDAYFTPSVAGTYPIASYQYRVYRGATLVTDWTTTPVSASTTFPITGLVPSSAHTVDVRAVASTTGTFSATGTGSGTTDTEIVNSAPTVTIDSVTTANVTFTRGNSSGGTYGVEKYRYQIKNSAGTVVAGPTDLSSGASHTVAAGVSPDATFTVEVWAISLTSGAVGTTGSASGQLNPETPTTPTATWSGMTTSTHTTATMSISKPSYATKAFVQLNGGTTYDSVTNSALFVLNGGGTAWTFTLTGIAHNTSNTFRAFVQNRIGGQSDDAYRYWDTPKKNQSYIEKPQGTTETWLGATNSAGVGCQTSYFGITFSGIPASDNTVGYKRVDYYGFQIKTGGQGFSNTVSTYLYWSDPQGTKTASLAANTDATYSLRYESLGVGGSSLNGEIKINFIYVDPAQTGSAARNGAPYCTPVGTNWFYAKEFYVEGVQTTAGNPY